QTPLPAEPFLGTLTARLTARRRPRAALPSVLGTIVSGLADGILVPLCLKLTRSMGLGAAAGTPLSGFAQRLRRPQLREHAREIAAEPALGHGLGIAAPEELAGDDLQAVRRVESLDVGRPVLFRGGEPRGAAHRLLLLKLRHPLRARVEGLDVDVAADADV